MSASPRPTLAPTAAVSTAGIAIQCLIWGSTWLVIREGLRDLPPFTSAGVRFAVAGLVMAALAPWLRRVEGGEPPPARLWVPVGVLSFATSYGIVYRTETILPSSLVSVLWAVYPMMMAALGHRFLPGERLVGRQWAGFVLGFLGVAFLVGADPSEVGPESVPAALILLVSPAVSAVATLLLKRGGAGVSSVLLNRNAMLLGAVLLLSAARLVERDEPVRWTPRAIGSVAYLAIAGTVVAFGLYHWLLRAVPASRLSLIAYVIPVVALFLGWAVGEERVTAETLGGAGAILTGVVLVVRRGGKTEPGSVFPAAGKTEPGSVFPPDSYADFVEHPRYGRGPRFTGLEVETDFGGDVYLHWSSPPEQRVPGTAIPADVERQAPATVHVTHYVDVARRCRDCGRAFLFFAEEQRHWYEELGFGLDADAVRCVPCRKREQGLARARRRYEELFHLARTPEQDLEMAENALILAEAGAFGRRHLQRVRALLKSGEAGAGLAARCAELRARLAAVDEA